MTLIQGGNTSIISALSSLGSREIISNELKTSLEKLVVLPYSSKRKDITVRYSGLQDVGVLCWELHSKCTEDSSALPPMPSALKYHILRANYIVLSWKRYIVALDPPLPNLVGNGWDENLVPVNVMMDELPAPEFYLELTVCKCKKTNCANNQCSCHKNKLACTEACQCNPCKNETSGFEELDAEE